MFLSKQTTSTLRTLAAEHATYRPANCQHTVPLGYECPACRIVVGGTGPAVAPNQVWYPRGSGVPILILSVDIITHSIEYAVLSTPPAVGSWHATDIADEYWYWGEANGEA